MILGNVTFGGKSATFTNSNAIRDFLPSSGTSSVFTNNTINPSWTSAGVFAGQLLTALLNARFSTDFTRLANLEFVSPSNCSAVCSSLQGKSIFEVIYIANQVIANQPTITYWNAYTPSCLNNALTFFNEAFDKCKTVTDGVCFECPPLIISGNDSNNNDTMIEVTNNQASWLSGSLLFYAVFISVTVIVIFVVIRARRSSSSQSRYSRV